MDVQNILVVLFLRHTSIDILTLRGLRSNHLHYPGDERDWKYGQLENKLETNIYYWYNILKFNWIFAEVEASITPIFFFSGEMEYLSNLI